MNNALLAKVLLANGLATKEQVQAHWSKVSESQDIASILRDAGLLDASVHRQVLSFVTQMEAPHPPPPSPAVSQQSRSISQPQSAPPPPPPQAKVVPPPPTSSPSPFSTEFVVEGNNPYGGSFAGEMAEEIHCVEGLQETRMDDFRPTASIPIVGSDTDTEAHTSPSPQLPASDWLCDFGEGMARQAVAIPMEPPTHLDALLAAAREMGCSDLYLTPGTTIWGQLAQNLRPLGEQPCSGADVRQWFNEAMERVPAGLILDRNQNLRVAFAIPGAGRFRMVVTWTTEGPALAIRIVPIRLPSWRELGIPEFCEAWLQESQGLILVSGPNGSGRSSTAWCMAATVLNSNIGPLQVIADPLEYLWNNPRVLHTQVGLHGLSGEQLIRNAIARGGHFLLVEDMAGPGELEAILDAAESGFLVVSTIPGMGIAEILQGITLRFTEEKRKQIWKRLVRSLKGILNQHLFPSLSSGQPAVAAFGVLGLSPTLVTQMREQDLAQITSLSCTKGPHCIPFEESLKFLVEQKRIPTEVGASAMLSARSSALATGGSP
ncbi:MAG TPA: ATPase, T2SS/T4P/T4SS family [Fibrobacteraceae bacterium]|nr:ATPase, T2SS/T4P/T4SS family [Fibrobacteraceae bacterium]